MGSDSESSTFSKLRLDLQGFISTEVFARQPELVRRGAAGSGTSVREGDEEAEGIGVRAVLSVDSPSNEQLSGELT